MEEAKKHVDYVRKSLNKDKQNLLESRKALIHSPEKYKPSKHQEKHTLTAPSKLRRSSQDTVPSHADMDEVEFPYRYEKQLEVIDLRIQNIERTLNQVVQQNFTTPKKEGQLSSAYSPQSTKDTPTEQLEEIKRMKHRINNLEKRLEERNEVRALFTTPPKNRNREFNQDIEDASPNSLKQQNQLLLKELEKKNSQLHSLIDLNIQLEHQLNMIREQNEKEFSLVEKVSYYLKDNLSKIIGGDDISNIEHNDHSISAGARKVQSRA